MKIIGVVLGLLLSAFPPAFAQASPIPTARDSAEAWADVGRLRTGSPIRVTIRDGARDEARLAAVFDDRIVLAPDSAVPRDRIERIERRTRGAILGGLLGTAAGGALGLYTAYGLAYKTCGGSCRDEEILIVTALLGMPIAGGYLGVKLGRVWITVYPGG
jgi:hypothetical protein